MGIIRASNEWEDRENAVKERLRSYRSLVSKHQACLELLEQLYPKVTTQVIPDRVICSKGNTVESSMIRKLDLEQQMSNSLQEMRNEIASILELIKTLSGREYTIIFSRYVLNEGMEKIGSDAGISIASCWRIHRQAIHRLSVK